MRWNRLRVEALVHFINPKGRMNDVRCHDQTASVDRERSRRRHRGATAEGRYDRPHRTADDRDGFRKVFYAILSFGGFLGMGTNLLPLPWGRLRYNLRFEAYELDIDDDELKRAPSFRADKEFDWGDRSQEEDLHRFYGMPPYWGGF